MPEPSQKPCLYCGDFTTSWAIGFLGRSVAMCGENSCVEEFDRDDTDEEQMSYEAEIEDVNARYGRGC